MTDKTHESDGPVGGIVLAAGTGTRFDGENKLTKTLDGEPVVRRAVHSLVDSNVTDIIVVVGHESTAVTAAIDDLEVRIVHNERYKEGQSTSVHTGVKAAREGDWSGAVFALGDMPAVNPSTIDALVAAHVSEKGTIIYPVYEGKRGNPVLFDALHFDSLLDISGDRGGRQLIVESSGSFGVSVDDSGVIVDIDRKADLEDV